MKSKDLQDAYLYGNIFKIEVQRARPRSGDGNKKNATFTYKIRCNGVMRKIYKKALLSLHGITKARLERLQKHLNITRGAPPIDSRGKHLFRLNKLPKSTDEKILLVIQNTNHIIV
ncbi:unnamed protein product [Psylliodes chrysocephalus]|uniref:Uncharacterized protein n=1 Tax=Psylliodes chrysocephalus TaxID=3402493 RepID=A0A9P0DA58_9CUCU|nr:unnamed protein product [Psylliodes chrysocephala]